MNIKLVALSVFSLALPGTVFADSLNWDAHGVCQVYRGARPVARADADQCRQILGSNFNWDRSGACYEWTPGGAKIGRGDIEDCRENAGSHYQFDNTGACYELTPLNIKIQLVRSHYCTDLGGDNVGGDVGDGSGVGGGYRQEPLGPGDLPGGPLGDSNGGNGTLQSDPSAPIAIEPPAPAPRPRPPGPLRTGYNWSDAARTMCILYSSSGYALHMAPPTSCKK